MTSAYQQWLAAGQPYSIAQPIAELAGVLRGAGYTVYVQGDHSHQVANPPEDHTPYSATGWPVESPRWWGHACDIMPPPAGSGLPSLAALGAQLAADRDAGAAPWIKYMNWSPANQGCQHWKWEPGKVITSSSDAGHIHLSIRSDWTHRSIGGYDPVARIHGGGPAPAPPAPAGSAPAWPGTVLRNPTSGHGTRTWQQKMRDRKWPITVDDQYGPASESVCRQFQQEKGLTADGLVGPQTWAAAWTAAVT